jgi:hypothetical protein
MPLRLLMTSQSPTQGVRKRLEAALPKITASDATVISFSSIKLTEIGLVSAARRREELFPPPLPPLPPSNLAIRP